MIIRRGYSVPENITMFYAGAGVVGSVYPLILAHTGGHGLECPLRALTGVPCPFCGLTTATVALTHGHWAAAAATSPLAYLVAALTLGTAPVLVARNAGWWRSRVPGRRPCAAAQAGSWRWWSR